jgi:EpsI family protein
MSPEPFARSVDARPELVYGAPVSRLPLVLAMVLAISLLLWPTIVSLHEEWTDTANLTFIHGYLIVAISVALLVRALSSGDASGAPDWRALPILLALSLCWLIAERAGIEIAHQVLWPVIMLTALCAVIGVRGAMRCWFPFAFLYFAIPVWVFGDHALQMLSVFAVKWMLQLSALPAFVEGIVVHIPEGVFIIEGGCNGMHFFIVGIALAALFGEIHHDPFKVRVRQILLAVFLALISNWIRIYVVIVAGHLTDMQHYLIRVSHYYFGWAVFAVSMALFFWLVSRTPAQPVPAARMRAPAAAPSWGFIAGALTALLAVGIGPALGALAPTGGKTTPHELLPALEGWQGPVKLPGEWEPLFPGKDRDDLADYRRNGTAVAAYIAEYDEQRQGKELVGYGNSLVNGIKGDATSEAPLQLAHGTALQLRIGKIPGESSVVAYFYEIGSAHRVSGLASQLTYAMKSLFTPVTSRIVAVRVRCESDCAEAAVIARQWLDDYARTASKERG